MIDLMRTRAILKACVSRGRGPQPMDGAPVGLTRSLRLHRPMHVRSSLSIPITHSALSLTLSRDEADHSGTALLSWGTVTAMCVHGHPRRTSPPREAT